MPVVEQKGWLVPAFVPATGWGVVPLGAGGWITGLDIHSDGTMVCRPDTYGSYLWDDANQRWNQLISLSSMPEADHVPFSSFGGYEICIAPSNSSVFYLAWQTAVYRSADRGATWTKGGLVFPTWTFDSNSNQRYYGRHMAVDPQDENVVYWGVPGEGVYVTANGGVSWTAIASIPLSDQTGYTIVFDAESAVSGGRQQKIYICSNGWGVYRSADGGTTWALTSAGPDLSVRMTCCNNGDTSTDSVVLLSDLSYNIWRWAGGAWTAMPVGQAQAAAWVGIACNPLNTNQVVISDDSGKLAQSADNALTFIEQTEGNVFLYLKTIESSATIPWQEWSNEIQYMSHGEMRFDPLERHGPGTLFLGEGIGTFWTNMLTTDALYKNVLWTSISTGIEQLVIAHITQAPGGKIVIGALDRGTWIADPVNLGTLNYPSRYFLTTALHNTYSVAAADDGTIYAINSRGDMKSTDGGDTFSAVTMGGGSAVYGCVAVDPVNGLNAVKVASNNLPRYTTNGTTWSTGTGGSPQNIGVYTKVQILCADGDVSGTFWCWCPNDLRRSTDGGASWSATLTNPGSGLLDIIFTRGVQKTLLSPRGTSDVWMSLGQSGSWPDAGEDIEHRLMRVTSGGTVATAIPDITEVHKLGFGAPRPGGGGYPALYLAGYINSVYGVYRSDDAEQAYPTWTDIGWPDDSIDQITTIAADPVMYGRVYVGFNGRGVVYRDTDGA